jgi:hypothetical protein
LDVPATGEAKVLRVGRMARHHTGCWQDNLDVRCRVFAPLSSDAALSWCHWIRPQTFCVYVWCLQKYTLYVPDGNASTVGFQDYQPLKNVRVRT